MADINDKPMSIGEHLEELRKRIAFSLVGILPIFIVGLVFGKTILWFLVQPLISALDKEDVTGAMQATQVLEGFLTYLKIGVMLAIVGGGPWIVYQLWKFIAPGLYLKERRFFYVLAPMSVFFTALGVAFMYYVMLPFALFFFVKFNDTLITRPATPIVQVAPEVALPSVPSFAGDPAGAKPGQMWVNTDRKAIRFALPNASAKTEDERAKLPVKVYSLPLQGESFVVQHYRIGEYVGLVLTFAAAFALTFQTPVVVLLLGWTGILPRQTLAKYRKYALLVCTAIAAVVTPPDFWSMIALMVPMYALFEVGLLLLRILPAERVASGKFVGTVPNEDAEERP